MKATSILETIGRTPVVRINKLFDKDVAVWMKLERNNPGGSIKDRIALAMIEDAERSGVLKADSMIVEPTSGNTGVGLAMVAAVKGYPLLLVMPESMSIERRRLMTAYGAKLELTPREKGMKGAIERAREIVQENANAWMPMQFDNEAGVEVHVQKTAQEILDDFPSGVDYMITGVGTGGHITGVGKVLKKRFPDLKIYAVEPAASPVLSGGQPGPHSLQGIGAGFIPSIMDTTLLDGTIQIEQADAFDYARRAAREEGIFVGISSGASLAAVAQQLETIHEGATVLTFCYDTGERYLSVEGLFV
ncbi:cysteine synthase A [Pontibacter chitinilyticus]|uniref:cysteine synthase A n=1 Tax=Pontibacter chitinilyticus TaxID=2674989 RepID=UPI00321AEC22